MKSPRTSLALAMAGVLVACEAPVTAPEPEVPLAPSLSLQSTAGFATAGGPALLASGGDLQPNESVSAVECWSVALAESYLAFTKSTDGVADAPVEDGLVSDCGLFEKSLSDLGVPSLASVDPALMMALGDVAKNGVPSK